MLARKKGNGSPTMKKLKVLPAVVLVLAFAVTAFASDAGPWGGRRGRHHGGSHGVAEPAAIVLLGAGLASLGVYAFKKRNKK
jgi:LPXTG-motif cell wall-anchored protein